MLSRIFTKRIVQVGLKAFQKDTPKLYPAFRCFSSTSLEKLDKGKMKLTKALAREIKYEEENYQYDESFNTFIDETGFELKDTEADNTIELNKTVDGTSVNITFQSRSPQLQDENEPQEEDDVQDHIQRNEEEQDDQQYPNQDFCDFTVYIQQANGKSLAFECASFDSEINVTFVSVVDDVAEHKASNKLERNGGYSADFSILDERLQTAFLEYLKGFGVDEKLAIFIEQISLDKDQRLYVQWLRQVNNFINV